MAKFTNVDYNKNLLFSDSNPFANAFKEKYDEGKNVAIEAYKTKVQSTVDEGMYELRNSLKGPEYSELILNKGTDAEMLNPKFYDLVNASPEGMLEKVRASAKAKGINPKSIKPQMVMTDELSQMQQAAVRQHYDELARYADENGEANLQKLLDREGDKFGTFYRKFSDPYINESRGALWVNTGPGAAQGAQQRAMARKHPHLAHSIANGIQFKEGPDGQPIQTSGFYNNMNQLAGHNGPNAQGSQIKQDEQGRSYIATGANPMGALLSNMFGSGNQDMFRQYLADQENPDQWFDWAR